MLRIILLALGLILPAISFAQYVQQPEVADRAEASAAPSIVDSRSVFLQDTKALDSTQQPDISQWRPFDASTLGVQTLSGGLGGVLFLAAGYGVMVMGDGWDDFIGGAVIAYYGSSLIGIPLGVYLGGEAMDGNGSLVATFLGGVAGTGLGVLASYSSRDARISTPLLITSFLAGPILAYHLSAMLADGAATDEASWQAARRSPPSSDPFVPQFATDPVTPRPDVTYPLFSVRF
ncbi:MAG: hypothetical protein KFF77_06715 [Bacteroidetes bacterium]|nr:hypothetical protein [Bacteroidota bacterium]